MSKIKINRRTKYGTVATVTTILVTAIIILVNVVFSVLTNRFQWVSDMTVGDMYQISDESIEYLKSVDKKVEIFVLAGEEYFKDNKEFGDYLPQAAEVLNQYNRHSSNISLKYVDIIKDPTFQMGYPELDLQFGQILIKADKRTKVIDASDLFNFQTQQNGYTGIASSKAEQTMTSAIMSVTSDKTLQISMLGGFEGTDTASFSNILGTNNYTLIEQNILTDEIDTASDIVILAGIKRDLSKEEISKIDKFLDNDGKLGKTVFYLAPAPGTETPNLDAFLKDWGLSVEQEVIYETDSRRLLSTSSPFIYLTNVNQSDFTETYDSSGYIGYANARPINTLFENSSGRTTKVLMSVPETAKAFDPSTITEESNPEDLIERNGPFNVMAMGTKSISLGSEIGKSNVIVSGSAESISESFLSTSTFSNTEYYTNMFNTLYDIDSSIIIAPKNFEYTVVDMTVNTILFYGILFVFIIPIGVILTGIAVWIIRGKRKV